MTGLRSALTGRRPLWAVAVLALALIAAPAVAQTTIPPGFNSVPRPPGDVVSPPGFVPPGGGAAIAPSGPALPQQPTVANPNPLQLTPPAAQPASLPPPAAPSAAAAAPAVPMVPAGQVALMVSARFGRDPP